MRKTILIDMTRLNDKSGFGELANNFSTCLADNPQNDLSFVFLVKEKNKGCRGNKVEYVSLEHLDHDLRQLQRPIDLWHSTDQLFIKRKHNSKMVNLLTIHDLNFLYEKKGIHRLKWLMKLRWRVRRSDAVTVISNFVKQEVDKHINMCDKPLYVIYNGIKNTEDVIAKKPAFVKDDKPFFFTIGQTREKKNFDKLIAMMQYFPDYNLYICGLHHGSYSETLKEMCNQNEHGNCFLPGGITEGEKKWLYEHCAAFLFPSRLEGFGLPPLEAMSYRCKVFVAPKTSLPEVCKEHASYFTSLQPEEMARLVRVGVEKWDKQSDEAKAEQEYVKMFSYTNYTNNYLKLYRHLLKMD